MKDFAEALALVLDGLEPLDERDASRCPRPRAACIAAEARAAIDLPPFDRTAMDGFAVRAAGRRTRRRAARASATSRRAAPRVALEPGTAARISTGAAIPRRRRRGPAGRGRRASTTGRVIAHRRRSAEGLHIRRRAEDVHAGDVLARPGDVLTVPRLSALASAGVGDRRRAAAPARAT